MTTILDTLFTGPLKGLERTLDLTWRRNQAISSNVANAETPGYRAVDLDFAGELKKAFGQEQSTLVKTDPNHMDVGGSKMAHLVADLSGVTKPDGNNVDIDIQMGQMAYNKGRYTAAATVLRKQLSLISNAIRTVA